MKKKLIPMLLVVLIIMTSFSACAKKPIKEPSAVEPPPSVQEQAPTNSTESSVNSIPTESTKPIETIPATTETPPASTINIEWTTVKHTETDIDGYTYEITFKVSPWILLSNTDVINSAWNEVSRGRSLPGFNDWGLYKDGSTYWAPYHHSDSSYFGSAGFNRNMTDMYYCIGTVSIKNITSGWDITSSNPRSFKTYLYWKDGSKNSLTIASSFGRIFYTDNSKTEYNGIVISPSLKSNNWGPATFIIMTPENFSPNFPQGEFGEKLLEGALSYEIVIGIDNIVTENDFRIGVIGKDSSYTPPSQD